MGGALGLVADVGRHSVRFALTGGPGGVEPRDPCGYAVLDYPTFTDALVAYLDRTGLREERLPSVLAVAGLARGDLVNITGSRWFVSLAGVEAVLQAPTRALNECAASALALTLLPPGDFTTVSGPPLATIRPGGTYLIVNPGTGLGVAALISDGDRLVPLQTEAGHVAFAPQTDAERQIAAHLARRNLPISNETMLSSAGLTTIYAALAAPGMPVPRAEDISRGTARDPVGHRALDIFMGALGSALGDYVLSYGAWDGVLLIGPVARALGSRLGDRTLRTRMEDKDAFRRQLSQLPIALVRRDGLELLGAAAALAQR